MGFPTSNVLVLNRFYMAVHVVDVRRALCLLYKQAAEVVSVQDNRFDTYDFQDWKELSSLKDRFPGDEDEVLKTVSFEIRVPLIIRLLIYDHMPRHHVRFNRRNIFARDGNRCQYCGKRQPTCELSLDHVLPRRYGGKSTWTNLVCACTACNARKGGRTPSEASMRLVRQPRRPRRNPVFRISLGQGKYRTWRQFVKDAYWSVELEE
jgi:5-methylcytosine-specific restriction endonuclease McrA